jgi:hypothetical protein
MQTLLLQDHTPAAGTLSIAISRELAWIGTRARSAELLLASASVLSLLRQRLAAPLMGGK